MIDCPHPHLCGAHQHFPDSQAARACRVRGSLMGSAVDLPVLSTSRHLAGQPVPTVDFGPEDLYHVGTLEVAHKGGTSFEGRGLSVSMHPEDWIDIARLGGLPTWSFDRSGNSFLDLHSLSEQQRQAIAEWGLAQGYVQTQTAWQVSWYDSEMDDTVGTLLTSQQEAQDEAEDREDAHVSAQEVLVATENFPDPTVRTGELDPFDVLVTVWAEQNTDFDGVWWEDDYSPETLSCPRGVILPSRLDRWNVTEVQG